MNKITKKDSIYLATFLILVAIDYLVKVKIKTNMSVGDSKKILGDFFRLTYIQNKGAAFGMMQGQKIIFFIVGIIAISILIYTFSKVRDKISKTAITMIISGAIGNMIDRLIYGFVVDMFDFSMIWSYVFNVADICVVLGVGILCLSILKQKD